MKYYFYQDHYILFYTQGGPCWRPMKIRLPLLLKPWRADVFPRRLPRRSHHGWGDQVLLTAGRPSGGGLGQRAGGPDFLRHPRGSVWARPPPRSPHTGDSRALRATEPRLGRKWNLSQTALLTGAPQTTREGPRTFSFSHQKNCWDPCCNLSASPSPNRADITTGWAGVPGATPLTATSRTNHRACSPAPPAELRPG